MTNDQPPVDPTVSTDPRNREPQLLPSIDPSSVLGKALRDALGRIRFANVDPAIQRMAQDVMDGRKSPRDLLALPEFRPIEERAANDLRAHLNSLSADERAELLRWNGEQDA